MMMMMMMMMLMMMIIKKRMTKMMTNGLIDGFTGNKWSLAIGQGQYCGWA